MDRSTFWCGQGEVKLVQEKYAVTLWKMILDTKWINSDLYAYVLHIMYTRHWVLIYAHIKFLFLIKKNCVSILCIDYFILILINSDCILLMNKLYNYLVRTLINFKWLRAKHQHVCEVVYNSRRTVTYFTSQAQIITSLPYYQYKCKYSKCLAIDNLNLVFQKFIFF